MGRTRVGRSSFTSAYSALLAPSYPLFFARRRSSTASTSGWTASSAMRKLRKGSAFDGRPSLRFLRSVAVSKVATGSSAARRRTLLGETPTTLAVSTRLWPARRRTCTSCLLTMSIIPSLATTTRRRDRGPRAAGWRSGVARISGIGQVRVSGTHIWDKGMRLGMRKAVGTRPPLTVPDEGEGLGYVLRLRGHHPRG